MQGSTEPADLDNGVLVEDRYVRLTLSGESSLAEVCERIDAAIRFSLEIGKPRLLADVRKVTGFGPPNIVERSNLIERWAASARGKVKAAIILRPELTDPDRIGVTMARNRSFVADAFEDEPSALAWLLV